jgi:acyl-CoA thioester hydrolase
MAFEHPLRVRFGEADPQGIVFNAHYVAWMDVALTELFRDAIGSWDVMNQRGIDAVVAEVTVRFLSPARADDLLTLSIWTERVGTTSVTFVVQTLRDGELLAEGRMRHVFVDRETWTKTAAPDWLREALERYVTPAPTAVAAPPASSGS